ncbi:MAG: selenocysteine-specific translation elongation factor [Chloroflexi bacterium]|nr:MAG: selenocysteine-specific translation elongation factor [Chloroflexota bacterium]
MHVIGTAGHVDHGKSTLVKALTGIDPDRLAEEKAREMTIDLGFAWLKLGSEEVGVVDVPGHRDFIENMLAGVGGIDLALFVIAADEGVMPQTKEHLAILDLLHIPDGVIALTKTDLIEDPDWLELVMLDIEEAVAGTVLANAPIVPVSARTGEGLAQLKAELEKKLAAVPERPDLGRPRLPVDRVFSLAGFGTVVTGTLTDGRFHLGDSVEIQPTGLTARIRGLQTHKTKLETARPGSRVAINLTGIDRDQIARGDVLTLPGTLRPTILLDAIYRHLPDADAPLRHNTEVKFFVGAAEVLARVRVLGVRQIEPGQEGWIQLALQHPVATVRGDRFILRRPSPPATLGGGRILDPYPGRRHRRFHPKVLARLETLTQGTPAEMLLQALVRIEPATKEKLLKQASLEPETAESALQELIQENRIVTLGQYLLSQNGWQTILDRITTTLADFHRQYPLRLGMSREELRSRLQLPAAVFNPLLSQAAANSLLVEDNALVHAPDHTVSFTPEQQAAIDNLWQEFKRTGVNSPSIKECKSAVGEDVYNALVEMGKLQPLNKDVVYPTELYQQLITRITDYLKENGRINAAQTRDLLQTSRKYAIALLEHLDEIKVTRRIGDDRELVQNRT